MSQKVCNILGARVQTGASQAGCLMGPDAFRTAGLARTLSELGANVHDLGDVQAPSPDVARHPNSNIHHLSETVGWVSALEKAAYHASEDKAFPIFLGGDHSMSAGTVPGVTRFAQELGQPQFVLWLDAHPDLHSLDTTDSGNLHGTPVAYFTGQSGFDGYFPPLQTVIPPTQVCMLGIRSVDTAEKERIAKLGFDVHDMRAIDEFGIKGPLVAFLDRVVAANGRLHVSLDVDFLEPAIAPAVGTTVPGGATFREAHLVMELLYDSGLVTSLDMVELNPFLDERGRTASLMVDLCASLFGRTVLDRPTRRF